MDVRERKITELDKKVYRDIQLKIFQYYDSEDINYKGKNNPKVLVDIENLCGENVDDSEIAEIIEGIKDSIGDFFSYLYRLIPPTKRKVHYSKELMKKIDLNELTAEKVGVLKRYADAFSAGKDMNGFLSNNIKDVRKPDFLLYTWHLYHLHMSGKFVEDAKQMKNNRSDTQLLCIINQGDVFFVDVIPHPAKAEEYFNIRSLEIILNNGWMEKIGFLEMADMIPETLEPKITEDKDIFDLYSKGKINLSFEFHGKGYCTVEPICSNRRPIAASRELIKINKGIRNLHKENGEYKGFQFGCDEAGKLLGLVEFEILTGERKFIDIF